VGRKLTTIKEISLENERYFFLFEKRLEKIRKILKKAL
jgi:hypothetical protein